MNYLRTARQIQTGLIHKGIRYKLNTSQFFSEEQNRMITVYSVTEKRPYKKKNGEMSMKDVQLLRTCSQVEVLKWFAAEWERVKDENKCDENKGNENTDKGHTGEVLRV